MRVFLKMVRLLMKEKMEYRANFILNAFAQFFNYGATYVVVWLFMLKFETIAGWTWPEIALLYSIGLFTYSIGASFSFVQMFSLEQSVREGTFDVVLTKPLDPYLFIIFRRFNLGYIAHVLISGIMLVWSINQLQIQWTFGSGAFFILTIVSGALLQVGLMTIMGTCAFFWVKNTFLFSLFFRVKEFINYPMQVYNVIIQIILVCVVPLAFVNYYPSLALLGKSQSTLDVILIWFSPAVGFLVLWIGYRFFLYGVNKYQGAGG